MVVRAFWFAAKEDRSIPSTVVVFTVRFSLIVYHRWIRYYNNNNNNGIFIDDRQWSDTTVYTSRLLYRLTLNNNDTSFYVYSTINNSFEKQLKRISLRTIYNWKFKHKFWIHCRNSFVKTIATPKHMNFNRFETLNWSWEWLVKYYIRSRHTSKNLISTSTMGQAHRATTKASRNIPYLRCY